MWFTVLKFFLSALIIVAVSEVAKRSGWVGGLIASLPLVSILSMVWLYNETKDPKAVADLSYSILWFILPSVVLFLALPLLMKRGLPFPAAMTLSCILTAAAYAGFAYALQRLGVKL